MDANASISERVKCSLAVETLRRWGVLKLRAMGVSMLPSVWPGDLLTIRSEIAERIEPGEIVLYVRHDRFFIHRVISKNVRSGKLVLIVRGDCMPENDPAVLSDAVLGKITQIQRNALTLLPVQKQSLSERAIAYVLCRSNLFRRSALRFASRQRLDCPGQVELVEAPS
jgi:signal peptidase I